MKDIWIVVIVFVLSTSVGSNSFAQTYESQVARTLILPGSGTDLVHTLTLQAPSLSAGFTLTFPSSITSGGLLTTDGSGNLSWITSVITTSNPMTSPGDMIYGGSSGTPLRLAATATANQMLLSGASAAPSWSTAATLDNTALFTLGANSTAGTIKISDGGATAHYASLTPATQSANETYTIPDAGAAAKVMLATSGSGISQLARNSSDITNSTTTQTAATGLSINVGANETWAFDFEIADSCGSGGAGTIFTLTWPSGATVRGQFFGGGASATNIATGAIWAASSTLSVNSPVLNATAANRDYVRVFGVIANGSTSGTLQLQFAAKTAAQVSAVMIGSYVIANKF